MADTGLPPAPVQRQSAGQWRAYLFGDAAQSVFAVLRGARLPGLLAQLAAADVENHDCLVPGALPAADRERAPWLVQLAPASTFTRWVLDEARAVAPDFGLLALGPVRFAALRSHLRSLALATQADGRRFRLEWSDPVLLALLLPLLHGPQLQQAFGPLTQFVLPAPTGWIHHRLLLGRLQQQPMELQELAREPAAAAPAGARARARGG